MSTTSKINLRELLTGGPARLRYVYRYSTARVQHPETVAEHSHFVALYSLLIGKWVQYTQGYDVDMARLLERAIIHDLEEAVSGDFPRPFKYSTPELRAMLERASSAAMTQLVNKVTGVCTPISARLIETWHDAKDDTIEGRIVEFADFLGVMSFMMEEKAGNGNHSIERHCGDMDEYFQKFRGPKFAFLADLVHQAHVMMEEMFGVDYHLAKGA